MLVDIKNGNLLYEKDIEEQQVGWWEKMKCECWYNSLKFKVQRNHEFKIDEKRWQCCIKARLSLSIRTTHRKQVDNFVCT